MDHNKLLDLAIDLGCRLQLTGAETYRVEESVTRLLEAYGVRGEAYSVPNCLIVSLQTEDGANLTRMRRVDRHGTDLDLLEQYSGVSRKICAEKPPRPAPGSIGSGSIFWAAAWLRRALPCFLRVLCQTPWRRSWGASSAACAATPWTPSTPTNFSKPCWTPFW